MTEENRFITIIKSFLNKFKNKNKVKQKSNWNKKEMCKKSIQSGVCPRACEDCAWNAK